ncbi:non-specific lipid transfer protein-like 1 [Zea mays]|uniref:Non-specific lipid transfer protein-like 1 n=1 Tax=Zea mays TaxID=4577 RepID=B4FPA4_MAIZE|nr:non-specific lipid transfer protein-like 1 [Zea mays]ACF83947.1 unknown [Zea mays]ACG26341.1 xylogen protein 1 [Zea mays]ONL98565.1 Non-specific lipid transfer protein-like 1 [Zea mays]|eukprot:XP_008656411.1 non-specific lipid transfer protein-like 1 [Zea mays]
MALASRAAAAAVACVLLALAASAAGAGSNSPAPAPAVDCISQAASLIDCIDYVQKGSSARRPSAACCGEVKTAVASPVIVGCLCSLAGSNSSNLGFPIDMKRVLALPGACGASNAAFSKCNISALPPTEAPAPSAAGGSSSGGAAASSPRAAAASSPPMTATALLAAVAAPLLAYYCCYLF